MHGQGRKVNLKDSLFMSCTAVIIEIIDAQNIMKTFPVDNTAYITQTTVLSDLFYFLQKKYTT